MSGYLDVGRNSARPDHDADLRWITTRRHPAVTAPTGCIKSILYDSVARFGRPGETGEPLAGNAQVVLIESGLTTNRTTESCTVQKCVAAGHRRSGGTPARRSFEVRLNLSSLRADFQHSPDSLLGVALSSLLLLSVRVRSPEPSDHSLQPSAPLCSGPFRDLQQYMKPKKYAPRTLRASRRHSGAVGRRTPPSSDANHGPATLAARAERTDTSSSLSRASLPTARQLRRHQR